MARRAHIAVVGVPAVSHVLPGPEIVRELSYDRAPIDGHTAEAGPNEQRGDHDKT
ncbi:hypothetical protein [Nocardiopsis xinjiangensis]|uniref:hypothetical protein n=1 Tax=Nocardiopsis xinjiangensis TaxID=124285 RepID=UPI000349519C|nr:hypothetical protein [Nocardiopsis xinjiangensis]